MLQIQDISKQYKTGALIQNALNGVTLNLRRNEFVSILGPSGSGKTTLLNIIGGLDRYDSGDLVINGTSTRDYRDRDWDTYRNHTIGFVFQSYNLIPPPIDPVQCGAGADHRRQFPECPPQKGTAGTGGCGTGRTVPQAAQSALRRTDAAGSHRPRLGQ